MCQETDPLILAFSPMGAKEPALDSWKRPAVGSASTGEAGGNQIPLSFVRLRHTKKSGEILSAFRSARGAMNPQMPHHPAFRWAKNGRKELRRKTIQVNPTKSNLFIIFDMRFTIYERLEQSMRSVYSNGLVLSMAQQVTDLRSGVRKKANENAKIKPNQTR